MEWLDWEVFFRLALSSFLGGVIGYERQARHKSAGLRTNILVCLGSSLIMMLSLEVPDADKSRIAAQVVSGIGFLGAGAIMKEGFSVTGITTAACLWVVAGVGLAVGVGFYQGALITTVLVFIVLGFLGEFDTWMTKEDSFAFTVVAESRPDQLTKITETLGRMDFSTHGIHIKMRDDTIKGVPVIEAEVEIGAKTRIQRGAVLDMVRQIEGVIKVDTL